MRNFAIVSMIVFLFSFSAKATTVNSVCNGNWSNPNVWDTHTVPTSTDTVKIFNYVILDINVNLISPGTLVIDNVGSLCGNHNFHGQFLTNGPLSVNTLIVEGNSISNAWVSANSSVVNGSWAVIGGACASGCIPSCTLPTSASVSILASLSNPVCLQQPISFTATPTNGGSNPIYQWQVNGTNVGINSPYYSSSTLNNNDVVSVSMTSSSPCVLSPVTNSYTVHIISPQTPSVSITPDPANVCLGSTVTFTATPTLGGSGPIYQWYLNGVSVGTNSHYLTLSGLNNNDTLSVVLISNANCIVGVGKDSLIIHIIAPQTPSVVISPNSVNACIDSAVTFTATPTLGGTSPVYQWQVNGNNVGTNSSTYTLTNVVGGEQVSVILSSNANCISTNTVSSNTVTVTIIPPPSFTIVTNGVSVCPNEPDTIIAIGPSGANYTWTPSSGLNSNSNDTVIATNNSFGTHKYYVTCELNGCLKLDSVNINVVNNFTVTAAQNQTICLGQSTNISVTGGNSWAWSPDSTLNCSSCQTPMATPTITTVYSVTAHYWGCSAIATETVIVYPNANASFNSAITAYGIPQTIPFNNTSTNANSFYWNFGNNSSSTQLSPSNIYSVAAIYTVTLIAYGNNNCNDTLIKTLIISDTIGIIIPNVFTPNGDGTNDVFIIDAQGYTSIEGIIYDRWGLKVYEFLSIKDSWNGRTTNNNECDDGTYYYLFNGVDANNKAHSFKGFIQLIK